MEKKAGNKTVQPEEFTALARFADMVERRLLASRETARQTRRAEINAVKATLPQMAFKMPISLLELPDNILEALQPLENVGEIMWRFLIDEDRLRQILKDLPEDSLTQVQAALDMVVIPAEEEVKAEFEPAEDELLPSAVAASPATETSGEDVLSGAFGDEDIPVEKPQTPPPAWKDKPSVQPAVEDEEVEDEGFFAADPSQKKEKKTQKKKERQQRRQLIFDEEIGQVIARRRRKGGRGQDDWEDAE
jgi:hypothetical protein